MVKENTGTAIVECAFCGGKGRDPFEVMSPISTCPVCSGRREVEVREPAGDCVFCSGTGAHPRSRLTCTACLGRGKLFVDGADELCPGCGGTGRAISELSLPCLLCQGSGVVSVVRK